MTPALVPCAPDWAIDWPALGDRLPVTPGELAATPQDARFHSEGDVWTHTRMVVEALVADPEWRPLDAVGREVTFYAALAHDLGKPGTTRLEADGTITSRGHSRRGEQIVREWLWRQHTPTARREAVCRLVRVHQAPFFTFGQPDAAFQVQRRALALRNDWLTRIALADARGRRCAAAEDQARVVENCELYLELCRDAGVVDAPLPYADAHTRVVWVETAGRRPFDVPAWDDTTTEVIVMCGLPASGKDTWLARNRPEWPVVSLDALRESLGVDPAGEQGGIVQAAREAARVHLRAGRSFAWNATNIGASVRAAVLGLCRDYKARVHLVYCETTPEQQAARNGARPNPVPEAAIGRMIERWSVPTIEEAHRVTWVVDGVEVDAGAG